MPTQRKKRIQNSQIELSIEDQELIDRVKESAPEVAKKLPKKDLISVTRAITSNSLYSGPIPPPDLLREYNETIPNGAERIFRNFEKQSSHRREIEKKVIHSQQTRSNIGQFLGFILAIVSIISSVGLALEGHSTVASIIGGSTVIGLCGIFVLGKFLQNNNLKEKDE